MLRSGPECDEFGTKCGGAQRGSLRYRERGFEFVSPWYRHVHYGTSRWMQNAPRLLVAQFPYAKNIKILDCFVAQCDSRRTPYRTPKDFLDSHPHSPARKRIFVRSSGLDGIEKLGLS